MSQHYKRRHRANKVKQVKKKKKKRYKLCPAENSTNGRGLTPNTKISQFYISNCLCWLLFGNMLMSRKHYWPTASFFYSFCFSLITTCSPNCPTHSSSLHIWPALGGSVLINLFFTLQNYNSIHIFFKFNIFFFQLSCKYETFTSTNASQVNPVPLFKASKSFPPLS